MRRNGVRGGQVDRVGHSLPNRRYVGTVPVNVFRIAQSHATEEGRKRELRRGNGAASQGVQSRTNTDEARRSLPAAKSSSPSAPSHLPLTLHPIPHLAFQTPCCGGEAIQDCTAPAASLQTSSRHSRPATARRSASRSSPASAARSSAIDHRASPSPPSPASC